MENVYRQGFTNIYSMINSIAGKEIAQKLDPQLAENRKETAIFNETKRIARRGVEIFDLKNKNEFVKRLHDMTAEKFELVDVDGLKIEVSKMEILDIYNSIKNDLIKERYYNAFGKDQIDIMISNLTANEMRLADMMQRSVKSYKDVLNDRNIEITGRDMGVIENYWPSSSESTPDFYDDIKMQSETPSAMKQRSISSKVIPIPKNAWIRC